MGSNPTPSAGVPVDVPTEVLTAKCTSLLISYAVARFELGTRSAGSTFPWLNLAITTKALNSSYLCLSI